MIDAILGENSSPAVDPIMIAPKGLSAKLAVQPMATPPESQEFGRKQSKLISIYID